jgi:hypothetical protein
MSTALAEFNGYGLAVLCIVWFAVTGIGAYLGTKASNIATKEDVGGITNEVKKVEHQFNQMLEAVRGRNQLRLAAIDTRLAAHQETFTRWRLMQSNMYRPEIQDICSDAQVWWNSNCLYLEPTVRDAFLTVTQNAMRHNSLANGRASGEELKANFAPFEAFPKLLFDAIQLPHFSEPVAKIVVPENGEAKQELR